jgi:hypothetical protein
MTPVKKTWLIDPALVRKARRISGAHTETEAVTRALKQVVAQDEIDRAFRKYGPILAGIEPLAKPRGR